MRHYSLWDTLARDYFLNGIEGEMKKTVKLSRPLTLQDALQAALEYEAVTAAEQPAPTQHRSYVREVQQVRPFRRQYNRISAADDSADVRQMLKAVMQKLDRNTDRRNGTTDKTKVKSGCWVCGEVGHYQNRCPRREDQHRAAVRDAEGPSQEN